MMKTVNALAFHTTSRFFLAFALILGTGFQFAIAKTKTPELVVFGDSTSDTGNAFQILGMYAQIPYALIPPAPYEISDGRFSNDKIWIDRLAKQLDRKKGAKASLTNPKRHTNYATATARARPTDTESAAVGLDVQVSTFLNTFENDAPADALYVIWIGGNDIRDALVALQTDPTGLTSAAIVQDAVTTIVSKIRQLQLHGAQHILVMNSPNIGLLPASRLQGRAVVAAATSLTMQFNALLAGAIFTLPEPNNIALFDTFAAFDDVTANPENYDLVNVTAPCVNIGDVLNPVCDEPERYMFWDGIHPTAKTHRILSEQAEAFLSLQSEAAN